MTGIAWIVGLALLWVGLTGGVTAGNFVVGLGLAYLVLLTVQGPLALRRPLRRLGKAVSLFGIFLCELMLANLRVAWDVVTPRHRMRPGIVAVPLEARSDLEIASVAMLVSLTPGTLSLDVSDDRRVLYVHAMYLHDRERFVRGIKQSFERRLLEVLR